MVASSPARAADDHLAAITSSLLLDLNRHEMMTLIIALAALGFSVMSAIMLVRTRQRAVAREAGLRADLQGLQAESIVSRRCCSPSRKC